jgi:urease accessory protein UreF
MPGVLAAKNLRMFTSASLAALLRVCLKSTAGTHFELLATTTVAEAMQAIRNGQITAADAIVGFGGFIDAAADKAAERKLASKAKTIA